MGDVVDHSPNCSTDTELLADGRTLREHAAANGVDAPYHVLDVHGEPLRESFNAGVGTVRVAMLVSPTCGYCLRGAASVQGALRAILPGVSEDVSIHVVWVPVLQAEAMHVPLATRFVSGQRVTHYWDAARALVHGYRAVLGLSEDAWDVYLLYGSDARWDDSEPPRPAVWMHQLGTAEAPRAAAPFLNAHEFAERVSDILGHTRRA